MPLGTARVSTEIPHPVLTGSTLIFFFLNDAAPTEFSPLPLPDPLPISPCPSGDGLPHLSLVSLRRLSPQRGGRSLARPPLSLAERLQLLSCDLERARPARTAGAERSEEHTSELQSRLHLVCRLLLEKKKK